MPPKLTSTTTQSSPLLTPQPKTTMHSSLLPDIETASDSSASHFEMPLKRQRQRNPSKSLIKTNSKDNKEEQPRMEHMRCLCPKELDDEIFAIDINSDSDDGKHPNVQAEPAPEVPNRELDAGTASDFSGECLEMTLKLRRQRSFYTIYDPSANINRDQSSDTPELEHIMYLCSKELYDEIFATDIYSSSFEKYHSRALNYDSTKTPNGVRDIKIYPNESSQSRMQTEDFFATDISSSDRNRYLQYQFEDATQKSNNNDKDSDAPDVEHIEYLCSKETYEIVFPTDIYSASDNGGDKLRAEEKGASQAGNRKNGAEDLETSEIQNFSHTNVFLPPISSDHKDRYPGFQGLVEEAVPGMESTTSAPRPLLSLCIPPEWETRRHFNPQIFLFDARLEIEAWLQNVPDELTSYQKQRYLSDNYGWIGNPGICGRIDLVRRRKEYLEAVTGCVEERWSKDSEMEKEKNKIDLEGCESGGIGLGGDAVWVRKGDICRVPVLV
ncbi:hypothetical protein B0J14DRAFT_686139 [Halenospora varia]|nr:hypothetical protein B0J14DRAFT_686139 [Halenospora varia]